MYNLFHVILSASSAVAGSLVHAIGAGILLAGAVAISFVFFQDSNRPRVFFCG